MEPTSRILHIRHHRLHHQRRSPLGRIGILSLAGITLLLILIIFSTLSVYASLTRDLPSLQALPEMLDPADGLLLQPTRLYDHTGEHLILTLQDPGSAGAQYLFLESLPPHVIDAYIAVFQPQFWESPGYSLQGIWGGDAGSNNEQTIAQRLVSELLFWDEPQSSRRELRERFLAAQLVTQYGHHQVLEWSLNTTQFGPLIYGIDAAAHVFFGKSALDLNLGEAAILVAAAQSPNIDPLELPQSVLEQQVNVLNRMVQLGAINPDEAARAIQASYTFQDPIPLNNPAPAFTNLVLEQLSTYYPLERLQRGGLKVITTLDYDLQMEALCTSYVYLARLSGQDITEITIDGQPCEASRLLPTLPSNDATASGQLSAAVVILDPSTSKILAMVGGLESGADPAHLPGHPAGSILTPFVYLAGFARGFSPASLVWDLPSSPAEISENQGSVDPFDYHGPVRMRTALANDYLEPARKLVQQLGTDTALRLTQESGLTSLTGLPFSGQAMFDQPVLLLELAHSYTIFANQGILAGLTLPIQEDAAGRGNALPGLEPAGVIALEDLHGSRWLDLSMTQQQAVLAPQLAYLMTHVLSDQTARWPSLGHPNPLEIGRPVGAKLGLSSDGTSSWSVGYTPQRLTAVWLGSIRDDTPGLTVQMPAVLWHALMQYATRNLPAEGWDAPPGISTVAVCDPSGLKPTNYCPNIVNEVFITGSEPVQVDNLYQTFQVNRDTGHLATIFTAPEMIEERIYLVLPPEAVDWARETGLPLPPDSYDSIYVGLPASYDVYIESPSLFGYVSGKAQIVGSARGESFAYYRLQVGQGLNPQTWLTISQDITSPVTSGLLTEWDTSGLSGLYTLQLLVIRQDQSVERSILQVTVDNTPPQLSILYPNSQQQIKIDPELKTLLQATATDDLELARVEFLIDGKLIATLSEAPFIVLWQGQPGQHTLTVIAYDMAENTARSELEFELLR